MLVSTPVQLATVAALADDAHVEIQKAKYAKRRDLLHTALVSAGFKIEYSQAGLYLWATNGTDCLETVNWLAQKGILVAPGDFYGPTGQRHVRFALTATDERIASASARLTGN
jgi:aspartate/methionine/tyrosine aminotransferase